MKGGGGAVPLSLSNFFDSDNIGLKALTDHFGGGSRVVSFDPYS